MDQLTLADVGIILRYIALAVVAVLGGVWSWDRHDLVVAWCRDAAATVKGFAARVTAPPAPVEPNAPAERTNERTNAGAEPRTVESPAVARLRLDRTRTAVMAVLIDTGWSVTEVRSVLKGETAAISREYAELANRGPEVVETPIAGRPTAAQFRSAVQ